jgi:hypothetical protein
MLTEYNKVTIPAMGGNPITLEVNFSEDPDTKGFVKVNGRDIIKMEDLYRFLLVAGGEDIQTGLMPVQQKEVQHFSRVHRIRIDKPLKVGTIIPIRCEFDVEKAVYEGLAGLVGGKTEKVAPGTSTLILPKAKI